MTIIFILLIINSFFLGRAWDEKPKRPYKSDDIFFVLIPFVGFLLLFYLAWKFLDDRFHLWLRWRAFITYVPPSDLEKLITQYKKTPNKVIGIILRANGVDVKNLGKIHQQ